MKNIVARRADATCIAAVTSLPLSRTETESKWLIQFPILSSSNKFPPELARPRSARSPNHMASYGDERHFGAHAHLLPIWRYVIKWADWARSGQLRFPLPWFLIIIIPIIWMMPNKSMTAIFGIFCTSACLFRCRWDGNEFAIETGKNWFSRWPFK